MILVLEFSFCNILRLDLNEDWPCRKLKHQPPTGALVRIAKASGFTCVSEMLSKMEAEKLELSMVNNTNVGPIKEDALGKVVFSPYFYVVVTISFLYLMVNKALFYLCNFN